MNTLSKTAARQAVGLLAFLATFVGVTEALAPYVWPSALLSLPAGLAVGVATTVLAYFDLTYRDERNRAGRAGE